jgi:hypothetical protein
VTAQFVSGRPELRFEVQAGVIFGSLLSGVIALCHGDSLSARIMGSPCHAGKEKNLPADVRLK